MSQILEKYALAVEAGDLKAVADTLTDGVVVLAPGANMPVEGKPKSAMMLSAAATAITDFKLVRTYDTKGDWSIAVFEGTVEGIAIQLIDQLHLEESGLINHVDVFLRPASAIDILLNKMSEVVKQRTAQ